MKASWHKGKAEGGRRIAVFEGLWFLFAQPLDRIRRCSVILTGFSKYIQRCFDEWLVLLLCFMVVIGKTGLWPMPSLLPQFSVSQNLTHNVFSDPNAHYFYSTYLQPAFFYAIGGRSLGSYLVFVSATTVAFFLIFLLWFVRFHGKEIALTQLKIIPAVTFPVFMVPFYWLGMDGMTLLLILAIMINFHSKWVFPSFHNAGLAAF